VSARGGSRGGATLDVAAVQTRPVFGDVAGNVSRAVRQAERGAPDAALYVFPELATSGYAFSSRAEAKALAETPGAREAYAPGLSAFAAWARARRTHVIVGFPERAGRRVFNSAALLGPDGRVKDVYRKLHLFDDEKLWFVPGDRAPVLSRVGPARVGMLICYDWRFPEIWRSLALAGADVIAHPSNFVVPRAAQQATLVRALENRVYVITANRVGADVRPDRALAFTGRSQVAGTDGVALAKAGPATPRVLTARLDLGRARDKRFAGRNHLVKDRRPEFYGKLTQR
jgi:predicted amidohydrolase